MWKQDILVSVKCTYAYITGQTTTGGTCSSKVKFALAKWKTDKAAVTYIHEELQDDLTYEFVLLLFSDLFISYKEVRVRYQATFLCEVRSIHQQH